MMPAPDNRPPFSALDGRSPGELFAGLPTPCYIIDERKITENGEILSGVQRRTGCKILLAQKAFSCFDLYPVLSPYLSGTEASGLYEARLGAEEMPGREVHVFSAAYREDEFAELLKYADYIVFNSLNQLGKFGFTAKNAGKSVGVRINPECSTQKSVIYDPCAAGSRLGVTRAEWDKGITPELLGLIDGLHFHTLCEQDSDALKRTLDTVTEKFGDILPRLKWINFGGGQLITRQGYDMSLLEQCIARVAEYGNIRVYLEPGEAVALNAGYLATRVLDIVQNGQTEIAITDASAACHMPDVLEMPYTPPLWGAVAGKGSKNACRLAGPTCLAGDIIGDYIFEKPPQAGDILLFGDMAIYSICKNNTFNGTPLPAVYVRECGGKLKKLVSYGYGDFKRRLGRTIGKRHGS